MNIVLILISVSFLLASICNADNPRQTSSYPKDILFAEAYYDAALNGELKVTKKKSFLLSSLKLIGEKVNSSTPGGIYEDSNGDIWVVKKAQTPVNEYVGSKVMNLLIGPLSPEVELLDDAPGYTASKFLPNFVIKSDVLQMSNHKPIVGEEKLLLAMDLMGLSDRKNQNLGYIETEDALEAARVDFDHSFFFGPDDDLKVLAPSIDSKAVELISSIPDEMFFYVMGNAYNELWEVGIPILDDYYDYKNLGTQLVARKNALKKFLPIIQEIEAICDKAKKDPTLYTREDNEKLSQLVFELTQEPLIHWAIDSGRTDLIGLFTKEGADIDAEDQYDRTSLYRAVMDENLDLIRILLENGADANIDNKKPYHELLHLAIDKDCNLEIARLLLEHGANVNAENVDKQAPLGKAINSRCNLNFFRLLLEYGANVNAKDKWGQTMIEATSDKDVADLMKKFR